MKVRHLLNLKIACITFLLACATLSAVSQENKVYLGSVLRDGNLGKALTTDSVEVGTGLETYYWFTLHEDTAFRYFEEDCAFKLNPLHRAIYNSRGPSGFTIEGSKGHTVIRYLHYDLDSIRRAMHMLLKYGASSGAMASNIFWGMQELKCYHDGVAHSILGNEYLRLESFRFQHGFEKHSQSQIVVKSEKNQVIVCFKGIQVEDLPALMVLEYLLKQEEHSFQENMVHSGICLEAEFSFNGNNLNDFIGFRLQPNPFAVSESVEELFNELDKMPLFNYTNKEQLDLAKMQIAIDLEFMGDRTFSSESWNAAMWANGSEEQLDGLMDSIQKVTKVDLMNLINTYIHKQPFFLAVETSEDKVDELRNIIKNTKQIDRYKASFNDVKDTKLDDLALAELEDVAYILNLTSWAPVEVHLYSSKKRSNLKREKAIAAYFKEAGVSNEITFLYHRNVYENHRNLQDTSECATFSIANDEE